jgi:hypothetical protein
MRYRDRKIFLIASAIALSVLLYLALDYVIFKGGYNIFLDLAKDIAILPAIVLGVKLIIDKVLNEREKRTMLKKLNMVIGAFFSEAGTWLLKSMSVFDPESERIRKDLLKANELSEHDFLLLIKRVKSYDYRIDIKKGELEELRNFLIQKNDFFLRLLENPSLLEHESFTNLLWAVFHLAEELGYRKDVKKLPDTDYEHLAGDIKRVYALLVSEWLAHMKHLKHNYPYLFSLAIRMNPFNPDASPEVR